ncbi:site-specific tyrosine recombinase XerD [Leucobacter sp. GX24907]
MTAQPQLAPRGGIERFLRHIAIERGLSPNSRDAYRRDLEAYEAWLEQSGIDDLATVSPQHLSEYVAHLGAPKEGRALSHASITRRISTVRGMHRFLYDEGLLPDYAARGVRTPKLSQRLPKALSVEEVEALLHAADSAGADTPVALRDRALLELLYASGARVSEAVGLDVDDLLTAAGDAGSDPEQALGEGGFLRVTGKGSKQRIVPYGRFAGQALAAYLVRARPLLVAQGRGTPALFVGPRGGRVSRQTAWLIIKAAAERAELAAEVSPHTLRHSFATHLLQGGADVRTVQEMLGHASVTTTQIYTRVTADTLREHYLMAHPRAR